jgi:hypothetical protein
MQPTPIRSSASLCFAQNDKFKISHSEKNAQGRLFLPLQKRRWEANSFPYKNTGLAALDSP